MSGMQPSSISFVIYGKGGFSRRGSARTRASKYMEPKIPKNANAFNKLFQGRVAPISIHLAQQHTIEQDHRLSTYTRCTIIKQMTQWGTNGGKCQSFSTTLLFPL